MHKKILALACASALSSQATEILISGAPDSDHASFQQHQYLAQSFAVTGNATLDSLSLFFDDTHDPLSATLQLVDSINQPSSTVLFSAPFSVADGMVSIPLASTLIGPGAYFFVISTTDSGHAKALESASIVQTSGVAGPALFSTSQNVSSPELSPFSELGGQLAFELSGTFDGVHDQGAAELLIRNSLATSNSAPDGGSTFIALSLGMAAIAGLRRK